MENAVTPIKEISKTVNGMKIHQIFVFSFIVVCAFLSSGLLYCIDKQHKGMPLYLSYHKPYKDKLT